jgi:glycosyltransferase involved in cell wall biosynthesis
VTTAKLNENVSISVVICAKNEAGGIQDIIESVKPYSDEVVVVDGHSTDETARLAAAAGARVYQDHGKGKGDAYRVGIQKATGEILVFFDADGSCEAADIPHLAGPIARGEADLVIGSRHKGGSDEWRGDLSTFLRAAGSGFLSVVINSRWKSNLTDVLYGFRAMRREAGVRVPLKATDFDVEQHMIVQFLKHGYRVIEVRSHEYCRRWGQSKLPTYRKAFLFFRRLFLDLVSGP